MSGNGFSDLEAMFEGEAAPAGPRFEGGPLRTVGDLLDEAAKASAAAALEWVEGELESFQFNAARAAAAVGTPGEVHPLRMMIDGVYSSDPHEVGFMALFSELHAERNRLRHALLEIEATRYRNAKVLELAAEVVGTVKSTGEPKTRSQDQAESMVRTDEAHVLNHIALAHVDFEARVAGALRDALTRRHAALVAGFRDSLTDDGPEDVAVARATRAAEA